MVDQCEIQRDREVEKYAEKHGIAIIVSCLLHHLQAGIDVYTHIE